MNAVNYSSLRENLPSLTDLFFNPIGAGGVSPDRINPSFPPFSMSNEAPLYAPGQTSLSHGSGPSGNSGSSPGCGGCLGLLILAAVIWWNKDDRPAPSKAEREIIATINSYVAEIQQRIFKSCPVEFRPDVAAQLHSVAIHAPATTAAQVKLADAYHLGNGAWYRGSLKNGAPHGLGEYVSVDCYYNGNWHEGLIDGEGELHQRFNVEELKFVGQFKQGVAEGVGTLTAYGFAVKGIWSNGKVVENVVILNDDGSLLSDDPMPEEGEWGARRQPLKLAGKGILPMRSISPIPELQQISGNIFSDYNFAKSISACLRQHSGARTILWDDGRRLEEGHFQMCRIQNNPDDSTNGLPMDGTLFMDILYGKFTRPNPDGSRYVLTRSPNWISESTYTPNGERVSHRGRTTSS
jgi:hypothetical protein